jgi:hypothetical protein
MQLVYVVPSALGVLCSPSRGVLVYSPVVLWVGWVAFRYRRTMRFPDLAALAVASVIGTFAALSTWRVWWGGYSYGPRLASDFIPWLFLLAVLGLDARRRALASAVSEATSAAVGPAERVGAPRGRRRLELAVGIVLAVVSVAVHAPGALQSATLFWNERLGSESGEPPLLWDWAHPQFLAAWRMPPFSAPQPPRD